MSNWMAEAAAEQHMLGLSCSFDCYRCEIQGMAHLHPCTHEACAEPQTTCYDETCLYEGSADAAFPCNFHAPAPPIPLVMHGPEQYAPF